jgi:excisionase family DNA binding protein
MNTENNTPRLMYSTEETANILGVSVKTVYRLLDRKLLSASKALRHKMIPRKSIDEFIATSMS